MPQSGLWSSSEMAEHWQQDVERRRQDFAEATQRMLESAGLGPGDHVLDIAAGTGDQSILAARRVGPGGSILATDISADMLGIAARVAQQEGLTTITTRVMDAQQLDLEDNAFDAVICRLALIFERELTEAGFDEVITRALPFESHYASLDAFLQSTASRLTAGVMGQLRKPEQQHLLGEVRQALSQFEGSHGLVAPAELLLGVGSKEMRLC